MCMGTGDQPSKTTRGSESASGEFARCCPCIYTVMPVDHLMHTAKHLYLKDFRKRAAKSGVDAILRDQGAFTVFVPENQAFAVASRDIK